MIKSYSIVTTEIDNMEEAARQIAEQVASIPLLANTLGIITAHPEFVSSGTLAAVAKTLPFPVIGMTSITHYAGGKVYNCMLSVMVLTSDDCDFVSGLSDPIREDGGNADEAARGCYEALRAKAALKPKLMLIYSPYFHDAVQSDYVGAIAETDAELPMFGAVANDDNLCDGHRTIFGGEAFSRRIAMALLTGEVNPQCYVAPLVGESVIMPRVGVITKVRRNYLVEINNMSAHDFFKAVGFISDNNDAHNKGMLSSILVMHTKDGEDILRLPFITKDGEVGCAGQMIAGAPLSIAFNTKDSVLQTAKALIDTIHANHTGGTVILNTCLGRRFGLLGDPMAELELIRKELSGNFNSIAVYSSGEMCPVTNGGGIKNIEHNQALVACVL